MIRTPPERLSPPELVARLQDLIARTSSPTDRQLLRYVIDHPARLPRQPSGLDRTDELRQLLAGLTELERHVLAQGRIDDLSQRVRALETTPKTSHDDRGGDGAGDEPAPPDSTRRFRRGAKVPRANIQEVRLSPESRKRLRGFGILLDELKRK